MPKTALLIPQLNGKKTGEFFSYAELMHKVKTLDKEVETLSFTRCNLFLTLTPDELIALFEAIPPHVKHLDLQNNYYPRDKQSILTPVMLARYTDTLASVLSHVPSSIKFLNLGFLGLGFLTGAQLAQVLSVIKQEKVSLQGNDFLNIETRQDVAELSYAFSKLNPSVSHVIFSYDQISQKPDVHIAIASLPESVRILDLSHCYLSELANNNFKKTVGSKALLNLFASIPKGVQKLIIANNGFYMVPDEVIIACFYVLRQSDVKMIDLSQNFPMGNVLEKFALIDKHLPGQIHTVYLSGTFLSWRCHKNADYIAYALSQSRRRYILGETPFQESLMTQIDTMQRHEARGSHHRFFTDQSDASCDSAQSQFSFKKI